MTLPTWLRTFLDIDIPPLSPSERRRATLGALLFEGMVHRQVVERHQFAFLHVDESVQAPDGMVQVLVQEPQALLGRHVAGEVGVAGRRSGVPGIAAPQHQGVDEHREGQHQQHVDQGRRSQEGHGFGSAGGRPAPS